MFASVGRKLTSATVIAKCKRRHLRSRGPADDLSASGDVAAGGLTSYRLYRREDLAGGQGSCTG